MRFADIDPDVAYATPGSPPTKLEVLAKGIPVNGHQRGIRVRATLPDGSQRIWIREARYITRTWEQAQAEELVRAAQQANCRVFCELLGLPEEQATATYALHHDVQRPYVLKLDDAAMSALLRRLQGLEPASPALEGLLG